MLDWHITSVSWLDNLWIDFAGRIHLCHTSVAAGGSDLRMDSPNQVVRRFVHLLNKLSRLFEFHSALSSQIIELQHW